MGGKLGTPRERFETKYSIDPVTGCWNWKAALSPTGYGWFYFPPRNMVRAHTAAWDIYRGPRKGLCVLHHCDNPRCVNLAHLYLGTQQDNVRDREKRQRRAPPKGTKNGRAKLTEEQIRAIRVDKRWQRFIAREYGVSVNTIQRIWRGEGWSHVK